jgi:hypothetical protein
MSNPIDMLTVNQSFMDVFAGAMVRTNVPVKAKFFNPQPKEKTAPVYPEIVVQPIAPTPDEFVWVERQKQYNATDHTVTLTPPPIRSRFLFQVTMCSNRYDDALELMRLGLTAFKNEEGQRWITISDQRFDVFIQSIVPTPVIADGVFEDVFTYEVIVPLSLLPSKTVKAVTDFTVESTEGVEDDDDGGDEIKISIQS